MIVFIIGVLAGAVMSAHCKFISQATPPREGKDESKNSDVTFWRITWVTRIIGCILSWALAILLAIDGNNPYYSLIAIALTLSWVSIYKKGEKSIGMTMERFVYFIAPLAALASIILYAQLHHLQF